MYAMKRFLKTLVLLVASLFLIGSGVNAALDRLTHSAKQNSFTVYNQHGNLVFAYNGDLNACRVCVKPGPTTAPIFLHRS
jgi:hypothetical protein